MALVVRVQKSKDRKEHSTHYDSLYAALLYLSSYPIPLTKYRISTNKNVLSSLLSEQLAQALDNIVKKEPEINDLSNLILEFLDR